MKEIWKPVVGYEGLYEVSNLGRVKMLTKTYISGKDECTSICLPEKLLNPKNQNGRYYRINLKKDKKQKRLLVHRLVAEAFIKNPHKKPHINHIDGNKKNNTAKNLEWCTPKENIQHACEMGLRNPPKGEDHGCAKFKEIAIRKILSLFKRGVKKECIINTYDISRTHLNKIIKGSSWKHINNK